MDPITRSIDRDAAASWTFVADHLNTHLSATLVEHVAPPSPAKPYRWSFTGRTLATGPGSRTRAAAATRSVGAIAWVWLDPELSTQRQAGVPPAVRASQNIDVTTNRFEVRPGRSRCEVRSLFALWSEVFLYKIVRPAEWAEWQTSGAAGWSGSADDRRDGYIHLSTEAQVPGTLERFFAWEALVYVVQVNPDGLPVRWEPARDGALFPHVYGPLPTGCVMDVRTVRRHHLFQPHTRGSIERAGSSVAYAVAGEGETVTLFLMGIGSRVTDWGGVFPDGLAASRQIVLVDNRGAGASGPPTGPFSLADLAQDAVAVLDTLGVARADVIGFSMGGMIAQHLVLGDPARVRRLVLLSSAARPWLPAPRAAPALAPRAGASIEEVVRASIAGVAAEGWAEQHPIEMDLFVENARAAPMSPRTFQWQLDALVREDRRARLAEIGAPTLVVHGELDPLIAIDAGRELAAGIPGATFAALPGVGHLVTWEAPETVLQLVASFLD